MQPRKSILKIALFCCLWICAAWALGQVACTSSSGPDNTDGDDSADADDDADDDNDDNDNDDSVDDDDDASDDDDDDASDDDDDDNDNDNDDTSDDDDDDDDTDTGTDSDTGDDDDDDQGFACDEPDPGFEPFEKGASPPHYANTTVGGVEINLCDLSGKPILVSYGALW